MKRIKHVFLVWYKILVDYCSNCSLVGLRYIANKKYHYTERLFWLGCLLLSWTGSYYLIVSYMETFHNNAVSMVIENVHAREKINFPSVGICEMGYAKQTYSSLEAAIEGLKTSEDMEYNYDVEDFMLRIIFHNLYNYGSIMSYCTPYMNRDDCIKCPESHYNRFASIVRAECNELMEECSWNGEKFDCCQYFQTIQTTMGSCYLLNSIQLTEKGSEHWLNMAVGRDTGEGELLINITKASSAYILNEEDIPHMLLTTLQFTQIPEGYAGTIFFSLQNIVNDPLVRTVDPEIRRCLFPDENSNSNYPYYSYSVCVTECLKMAQIKMCNCCHHNMIIDDYDKSPICGFEGLLCLDQKDLMFPQTTIMQPWRTNGLVCQCLPSCTEHEIRVISKQSEVDEQRKGRSIMFKLIALPSQRYRRQIVRENLDVVVSIGGILGLFMGASILSLVELIYFFTVRFIATSYQNRHVDDEEEEYDEDDEEGDED